MVDESYAAIADEACGQPGLRCMPKSSCSVQRLGRAANDGRPVYSSRRAFVPQRVYAIGRFPVTCAAGFDPELPFVD